MLRLPIPLQSGTRLLLVPFLVILLLAACSDKPGSILPGFPDHAVVKSGTVNFRIAPSTIAAKIDVLPRGTEVKVLRRSDAKSRIGKSGDYWYYVRLANGVEGWLFGSALSFNGQFSLNGKKQMSIGEIRSMLVGKWWETLPDGSTGTAKIYFWSDGKYKQGRSVKSLVDGTYEISSDSGVIHLDHNSPAGERLELQQIGKEYRLRGRKNGVDMVLRKGGDDPDADDIDADVTEDSAETTNVSTDAVKEGSEKTGTAKTETNSAASGSALPLPAGSGH